jgi:uncharacterized membrane protein
MLKVKDFVSLNEGKILIIGLLLLFAYTAIILGLYFFDTSSTNNLIGMTITHILFGNAAGISYGYTVQFSDAVIIFFNMIIEFIIVMLIYPLFVLSWNNSFDIKFLNNLTTIVQTQRKKYQQFFDKYGKYGLFIFVWIPFWMTGPVVGAIIGFLIGMRHYTIMFIVLSGTSLSVVVWTYFLKELIALLNQFSYYAPWILLGLIILVPFVLKLKQKKDNF